VNVTFAPDRVYPSPSNIITPFQSTTFGVWLNTNVVVTPLAEVDEETSRMLGAPRQDTVPSVLIDETKSPTPHVWDCTPPFTVELGFGSRAPFSVPLVMFVAFVVSVVALGANAGHVDGAPVMMFCFVESVTVIFAEPLNDTPLMVLAVWSTVAEPAFPVMATASVPLSASVPP
jgi:hypothetical protein